MLTLLKIKDLIDSHNGLIFSSPNFLNLIGVRNKDNVNSFNDKLYYYWFDSKHKFYINEVDKFTTDPGLRSLNAPVSSKGCAILKEGWYRKLWTKGLHKGKYPALVQYSKCTVYRDKNKDNKFDFDESTLDTGMFGINLHRANPKLTSLQVDNWSAGCQVIADPKEFSKLMSRVREANNSGQEYFSYLLIDKSELQ